MLHRRLRPCLYALCANCSVEPVPSDLYRTSVHKQECAICSGEVTKIRELKLEAVIVSSQSRWLRSLWGALFGRMLALPQRPFFVQVVSEIPLVGMYGIDRVRPARLPILPITITKPGSLFSRWVPDRWRIVELIETTSQKCYNTCIFKPPYCNSPVTTSYLFFHKASLIGINLVS